MDMTIENICFAVDIEWQVALEADTKGDWDFRWNRMEAMLSGVWTLANVLADSDEQRALLEDIHLLKVIARDRGWWPNYQAPEATKDTPAFLRRQAD